MSFGYLLEAFWHLLDALSNLFWTQGRLLAHFGPGVQKDPKLFQIGDPGGNHISTRNFLHPGPEMGQESSRGPKKVAQGVQKVPKGFQKVAKSHEKDIHKASTTHPNAMRKCIGNSVGHSLSNAIANAIANAIGNRRPLRSMKTNKATKQQSNQATKQPSNKATTQQSNKATKQQSNKATKQQSNQATKQQSNKATKQQSDKATKQKNNSRSADQHLSRSVDQQTKNQDFCSMVPKFMIHAAWYLITDY